MDASLSLDELQEQLQTLAQQQAELERLLQQKRDAGRKAFIQEIHALISERGYDLEDIATQLLKRAGGGMTAPASRGGYADPSDPSRIYVRGPLPRWLKEQMLADGYDPASKEDRERFKAERLERVGF